MRYHSCSRNLDETDRRFSLPIEHVCSTAAEPDLSSTGANEGIGRHASFQVHVQCERGGFKAANKAVDASVLKQLRLLHKVHKESYKG